MSKSIFYIMFYSLKSSVLYFMNIVYSFSFIAINVKIPMFILLDFVFYF